MAEKVVNEAGQAKPLPFDQAYAALMADTKNIVKSAENTFFNSKYATLDQVLDHVKPVLAKHKFALSQSTSFSNGVILLNTELSYYGDQEGGVNSSSYPVTPAKTNDPQSLGSALTYARRYQIMLILGITATDEDDDGNKGSQYLATDAIGDIDGAPDEDALRAVWKKIGQAGFPKDVLTALTKKKESRKLALAAG